MTPVAGQYLFATILLGLSGMLFAGVGRAIKKGELASRSPRPIIKWEHPFAFWFNIAIYAVIATGLSLFSLALVGFAPHWLLHLLSAIHH